MCGGEGEQVDVVVVVDGSSSGRCGSSDIEGGGYGSNGGSYGNDDANCDD